MREHLKRVEKRQFKSEERWWERLEFQVKRGGGD